MGRNYVFWCALAVTLCSRAGTTPYSSRNTFLRSIVETVPQHESIPAPIRSSVESIPLRSLRDAGEGRLPLRDAVEKPPISILDADSLYKFLEPVEDTEEIGALRDYAGAAGYLNGNDKDQQDENANIYAKMSGRGTGRMVVCYLEAWAAYRAPPLSFTAGLTPSSCTHLHYAFAVLHPHTYEVIAGNDDYDIVRGGYRIATDLKSRMPGLRVLLTVGGEGTDRLFSEMVQEPKRRNAFIDSSVKFLREHNFDGLDLHWVYSGEKDEKEKDLLTTLLYEIREKFASYGLLLSIVLPPSRYQIEDGYDLSGVSGAADYAILQAWDMTDGKRNEPPSRAVQHSALYRDPGATSRDQRYDNVEFVVKYIIRHGMSPEKLILGVPIFGRSYKIAPSVAPASGAAVAGWGDEGHYTLTKGLLAYFEICMAEREGKAVSYTDEAGNSYAVLDNQFIAYDTPVTIAEKMKLVLGMGLGGAAAWAIDMDDFRGLCGPTFPILNTMSSTLNGHSLLGDSSSLKIGSCDSESPYLASDAESCAHYHFCSGAISYRIQCEFDRLYDPATGFCGHQDVTKCVPGQSLRISVDDAARLMSYAYEMNYEINNQTPKDVMMDERPSRITAAFTATAELKKSKDTDKMVVCYMTSWAFYRRGLGKFVPEQIDTRLCTHVVYAYASLSTDDLIAKEFDPWADVTNNLYERVTSLKDVKVLLGLGGWTDSAGDKYSRLVASSSARAKFIEQVVSMLRMYNFKGLHIDWNYPVCWQSNCKKEAMSDKRNFAMFIEELSNALHEADMELGVAISGYKEVIQAAYDLRSISKSADFLSAMTYDYHGGWEQKTAHHTPLVAPQNDPLKDYSIEYAIKTIINGGADPKKLLLGLSFYGQSYRLAEMEGSKEVGAAAAGPGEPGEYTKQPGMLAYHEICYRVKNLRWKTGYQDKAGPYAYLDTQWVGYDDPKSMKTKVEWAMSQGLGGVTAWAIDLDDFNNRCCAEPWPLLREVNRVLGRPVPPPPSSACERPPEPITPAPPVTTTSSYDGAVAGAGNHHEHTTWWSPSSTTPSTAQTWWSPSTSTTPSTAQTWWQPASITSTTTSTARPTPRPTSTTALPSEQCESGEYAAVAGECEAYMRCLRGKWHKLRCAPGLHWSATGKRCDWPSFANCQVIMTPPEQPMPTATLAPMTSRPPAATTTTTTSTTTTTTTTTTRKPTTTTTTPRPTTTTTTTTEAPMSDTEGLSEGSSCGSDGVLFHSLPGNCNAYLQCDGTHWHKRQCAAGLHWSATSNHCDWPNYAKCQDGNKNPSTSAWTMTTRPLRPTRPTWSPPSATEAGMLAPGAPCGDKDSLTASDSCDSYLLCVGGSWRKQKCPLGLHWDKRTNRCDWIEFAMCDMDHPTTKVPGYSRETRPTTTSTSSTTTTTTTTPIPTTTTTTTQVPTTTTKRVSVTWRPVHAWPTTTRKPKPISDESSMSNKPCQTGAYHPHQRCDKFYICMSGLLVTQSCAPGLVWRQDKQQCDFGTTSSCTNRRGTKPMKKPDQVLLQIVQEKPTVCQNGEFKPIPGDCTRYRHCVFGKYVEYSCAAELHWNQDKELCDWPVNAKCKNKTPVGSSVAYSTTTTETPAPVIMDVDTPSLPIQQHQYQATEAPATKPIISNVVSVSSSKPALLNSPYKLICYYTSWSWYRPGIGKFGPEDIDPTLCTHIIYGFAVLGRDGLITVHDTWADQDNQLYESVLTYKRHGIKVSLGVGGWNDSGDDKYSRMVNDPLSRAKFVSHAVQFLQKYGFDGLDIDWEYPKCWQVDCSKGPDSDKDGFANLVRLLSARLRPRGLLLSAAVSPNKMVIDEGYDVPVLARYLDWIGLMTYDYHGQWDKKTGHLAPLYYHPDDDNTYFNVNYTIHYWMQKGAPASKLIMGVPTYGQTFTLGTNSKTPSDLIHKKDETGLNVPAISGGEAGEYTKAKGFLAYYEICDRILHQDWTVVKDKYHRMGPYAYKDDQWVSFDDKETLREKANVIKSLGLGGGMIWSLDLDDFRNRCGEGINPLINTIKESLLDTNVHEEVLAALEIPETYQKPVQSVQITKPTRPPPSHVNNDDDLEDIEVIPSQNRPLATSRPFVQTTQPEVLQTTKRPNANTLTTTEERYKILCYYTNWAWYRPGPGKYDPSEIDSSLCTHIVYSYAVLDSYKLVIKPQDNWLDVENKFYEKVIARKNNGVKVLLALGGWNDSAGNKYSRLVNNAAAIRKFVEHVIDFLQQFGFDGLDLDWQFPKCWQGNCEKGPSSDKAGFALLIRELRTALKSHRLLLSATVSGNKEVIDKGYDVPTLANNLDWISLMTYDYHGHWEKETGHVAPMYASEDDLDQTQNVNFTVNYWLSKGVPKSKLIMGIPSYGQSFSLTNNEDNGIGADVYAGGEAGDETRARGFLSFYEICERIKLRGWEVVRDAAGRMGPYARFEDQWVGFDDDFMVRHKAQYIRAMGLGGATIWSLDLDDFKGQHCGCGKSPLLMNINHVLRGTKEPPPCQLEELVGPVPEVTTAVITHTTVPPVTTTRRPVHHTYRPTTGATVTTTTTAKPVEFSYVPAPSRPTSGSSLDGQPCSGVMFKGDDKDCSKYYLCMNGQYTELTCPHELYWNKNHCDWPSKSNCKSKHLLKLTDEVIEEVDKPIIACYFTNWAYYRHGLGSYGPEQVDPSMCTHIIYAFASLDDDTFNLVPGNSELDVENDFYGKITNFRLKGIKIILAVGGLGDCEGDKWATMTANPEYRKKFVNSALELLERWNFDGLQLAWQYPVCKQTPCPEDYDLSERDNFGALLAELAKELRLRNLELSAMVAASPEIATVAYNPDVLTATTDWIALAANDYYESTSGRTTYLMPLDSADINSFSGALTFWSSIIPTRQLVITMPAYGVSYTLRGPSKDLGAPFVGPGGAGFSTKVPGFLAYYEICSEKDKEETQTEYGTYAVLGSEWWAYLTMDEAQSIGARGRAAGVRGAAIWALDLDDWRGSCKCGTHPLLRSLRHGLLDPTSPPPTCL